MKALLKSALICGLTKALSKALLYGDLRKRFLPQKRSHMWALESAFKSAFVGCFIIKFNFPKYEICPHLFISSSSSLSLFLFLYRSFLSFNNCRRSCSFVCRRYCSSSLHSVPVPVAVRLLSFSPPFLHSFISVQVSFVSFQSLFAHSC